MLDVKRVLKAAPTKMRSQEPLQQLWTPWGEQIASEWLSSNAAHKAFCPTKDGERKLKNGRTPILNEHPRPTMMRSNHTMLNGFWDYAIVSIPESDNGSKWRKSTTVLTRDEAVQAVKEAAIPETFDGKILVPFSPESALSGVHQTIYPDNMIWYRTIVHPVTLGGEEAVRQIGDANRLILHFEAVDYVCACFINGQFAGVHVGGYLPFDVDISAFVDPDDDFEMALCVYDPNDSGTQMRGKQKIEREGIWYTAQSGIWQSVWMEIVPEAYMQTLTLKGAADGRLFIRAEIGGDKPNAKLRIVVTDPADGAIVADERFAAGMRKVRTEIATRAEHLWSPEDPYLYDVTATLEFGAAKSQEKQDIVRSYCAFRTVEIKQDVFLLNGRKIKLKGVNHHDTDAANGYTMSPDDIERDMLVCKRFNIDTVRTSHYPPDPLLLELADELGIYIVDENDLETHGTFAMQLPPTYNSISNDPKWESHYMDRIMRLYQRDKIRGNTSVIMWSLGNEAGGYHNTDAMYDYLKQHSPLPVHYESAIHCKRQAYDVGSEMYPSVKMVHNVGEKRRKQARPQRPYALCGLRVRPRHGRWPRQHRSLLAGNL